MVREGFILYISFMFAATSFGVTLSENGKSSYVIGVSNEASEPEKTAAHELQTYLKLVTGAELSVQSCDKVSGPAIWVGPSEKVKKLAPNVDWASLGTEGIVMKTVGDDFSARWRQAQRNALCGIYVS